MTDGWPIVRPLTDRGATLQDVGGKGLNLGIMLNAGLLVPGGFVITTAAYRAFVEANGLEPLVASTWAKTRDGSPDETEQASAALRAAFEAGTIPERLVGAITAAAPAGAVAVRSSATAEDLPDASFAGQQDTFLDVRGADAILLAVRRCWGSLWTARAMSYRARRGIAPANVALAVVVQEMAPASVSGVMFTVHPVTGSPDHVVLNASWGLGEAIVSGRVNPDTFVAEKRSGRIVRFELGDKTVMTAPTGNGTVDVTVDPSLRGRRALSDSEVADLVRLGRELEVLFGSPQDVEWAIVDGRVVLLQSRPVTTAAGTIPGDDAWPEAGRGQPQPFDFWTQQDLGERWPDPVTPLTWSTFEPMDQRVMDGLVAGLRAPYAGRIRWTRRAFGHVYLNEGALLHAYTHGFGMPLPLVASGLTHPGARPEDAERWRFGRVLAHLPFYWRAATAWERNVALFEADFPKIDAWVDGFTGAGLQTDADLLREARETWFERVMAYVACHTNATSLSMSAYGEVEWQMKKWLGDASLVQTLSGGLSGVIAAEMIPDLADLTALLLELELAETVLANPPARALELLRADPRAQRFLERFDRFLQRHGHRCMSEAELRFPRWAESPGLVITQLATSLRNSSPEPLAPVRAAADAATRRLDATARVERELGPFRRAAFRRSLERMHRFTRMRDNGQHYLVKLMLPMRSLYAALGARWVERGWLRNADDLFFLVGEELTAVVAAGSPAGFDLQGHADARRLAYDAWSLRTAPDALDAAGEPVKPELPEGDTRTITGLAASSGTVTGTARIVLTPQEATRLQPGDILVTRATDPGWTPVFSIIRGAVLEIGGLLSHGAIVAREYGIPAVVNVPGAMRRIVDGERISVNGTTGTVTLSAEAPGSEREAAAAA
jgi:pyruvate,water dikinase